MYNSIGVSDKLRQKYVDKAAEINAGYEDITEVDGFKITAEQCNAMNNGDREAIDKFFAENGRRLMYIARYVLRHDGIIIQLDKKYNRYMPALVEIEECINQFYIDLRRGFHVLTMVSKHISRAASYSFKYVGVGGFGDEDGVCLKGVL